MVYELIVGISVVNEEKYSRYREKITPLLEKHDGGFRYDFRVSEVLKNESDQPINRVFAIYFADELESQSFFSNDEYLKIKTNYFENAVESTVIISRYSR